MTLHPSPAGRVTILNDSFGKPSALRQEWGFAALIEFGALRILFDTGNNARVFEHNVAELGFDLRANSISSATETRMAGLFGGLHLVLTPEPEIRRIAHALRDDWQLQRIALGHCTGEPAFDTLNEVFGERYVFWGLGDGVTLV